MIDVVATFVFFFAVIDPFGSVPVFIAVTGDCDASVAVASVLAGTKDYFAI